MKLLKFTDDDGPIWVNPDHIDWVYPSQRQEGWTNISFASGQELTVKEDLATVVRMDRPPGPARADQMGARRMKTITLQPSAGTDRITETGTELTKLPYPFHVDTDGLIQRQDFWQGRFIVAIGFVADPNRMQVDLAWRDYVQGDLQQAVGMYVITSDDHGRWSTHIAAIQTVTVTGEDN
jgi:hypothetical protein